MARNGSGTMTPSVDFTTEAASPPIEIAKLDTALDDVAAELTNSIAADGQTNPTANLKMNGFKLTNLGAATALTDAVSATVVIDQELTFYVDSGAADAYVLTPSPAIAAYEEGQRFAFRAANTSTGASTLNVNGLGAIAIQTNDAAALTAGSILAGGYYEVTYDANTSPDRWVLTRSNKLSDGMLSSNVALKNAANSFTAAASSSVPPIRVGTSADSFVTSVLVGAAASGDAICAVRDETNNVELGYGVVSSVGFAGTLTNHSFSLYANNAARVTLAADGSISTPNASAGEFGHKGMPKTAVTADHTIVAANAGRCIVCTSAADDITVQLSGGPPSESIVNVFNATGGTIDLIQGAGVTLYLAGTSTTGSRTLANAGMASLYWFNAADVLVMGPGVG